MCEKHFNQTPAKSLPEANLHSDEGMSSHVGGTGKHPGLWTVCQLKQLIAATERKRRRRVEREGGTAFKNTESIYCQRGRNKGGKTDCVFKCVASSGASAKTRKSASSEEALQPLSIYYQHQIALRSARRWEAAEGGGNFARNLILFFSGFFGGGVIFVVLFPDKGAFGEICVATMNQTASVSHQIDCQPAKDTKVGLIFLSFYVMDVFHLHQLFLFILKVLTL